MSKAVVHGLATDPENLSPGRQVDALGHIRILKFFLADCSKNWIN